MTDKQKISPKRIVPPSPLNPYRSIIERDPIENHFTNKRLQKHMRHLGLVPKPPDTQNKDPTSLAPDKHEIWNSEKEKREQFRQKLIVTTVDSVREIDRARQAEFRKQLELWDKMYSNRVQRLQAYDRRIERKYGLFIDRAMKQELIREKFVRIPQIPSLPISRILPNFPPIRRINRVKPSESKRAPSAPPLLPNIDRGRSSIDELYNEVNKLKGEIEELKIDLNEIVKDQDMLKVIQLGHEAKISELNKLGNTLETNQTSHVKNFKNIQNKHEEFDNAVQTLNTKMKKFEETMGTLRFPDTMKKALLPYVERLAPMDLIEVDWKKHRQENEGNINN